jgi:hypothetical protein
MMVVPVFMINCQVSEKPKMGPVTSQTIISPKALKKTGVEPLHLVIFLAAFSKNPLSFFL